VCRYSIIFITYSVVCMYVCTYLSYFGQAPALPHSLGNALSIQRRPTQMQMGTSQTAESLPPMAFPQMKRTHCPIATRAVRSYLIPTRETLDDGIWKSGEGYDVI